MLPLLLSTALLASHQGLVDTSASPHVVVRSVGLGDVKWTTGFWADRFETCRASMIPSMGRLMADTKPSQFLHNFRVAAGLVEGRHRGPPWNDGDYYKWLEACAAVYAVTKDAALDRQMDEAIAIIAKAQRGDGYLHTPVLIKIRNGDKMAQPFEDRFDFEMYNFGHLFTTACVHHRATGKKTLLNVALKAAEFLRVAFEKPTPRMARNSVCPAHYLGTIELYRTTRDPKHLALAKTFLALRDLVEDGGDDNQDRLPLRRQTEAVGHAVRANYLYAGVADIYAETGDKTLLGPLEKLWASVVTKKMYVTGACGALYDGASPEGSREQRSITRTHQAYGRNYQLPNSTAHNETCAAIGNALWNWRMLQITGEARYADVLELVLYNALLAGVSLDGQRYFYTNTLRQLDTMPVELRWSRERQTWISCYCCPPNVVRTVAEVNSHAYGRSERGIWVHLYGGSVLETTLPGGQKVKLTQTTEYPWDGRVKVQIEETEAFALFLRIPGWASGAAMTVNGERVSQPLREGSYVELHRAWKRGDVVELNLPMRTRLLQSHPLIEETRHHVTVQRGPVVYCLESVDLPKDVRLMSVALRPTITLTPRLDKKFGVTFLEGDAQTSSEPAWKNELYREYRPTAARTIPVKLVPYYAWGNRGKSEMSVWLPLGQ